MTRVVFAAVTVCLAIAPALAASPKIDAAVKAFKAVGADPAKQKIFCDMSKAMDEAGDKPSPAADAKINGFMKPEVAPRTNSTTIGSANQRRPVPVRMTCATSSANARNRRSST